jgi:hypothetical protein
MRSRLLGEEPRMRRRRAVLGWLCGTVCLVVVCGCSSSALRSAEPLPTSTVRPGDRHAHRVGLELTGTLTSIGHCLVVEIGDSRHTPTPAVGIDPTSGGVVPVWPRGFTSTTTKSGGAVVLDQAGRTVARAGTSVDLLGSYPGAAQFAPSSCLLLTPSVFQVEKVVRKH